MNNELQRMVNIVKEDAKLLTLVELLDLANPIIEQLAILTDDARRSEKLIGWDLAAKKDILKKMVVDIDLLKIQKAQLEQTIVQEQNNILEEKQKANKELNLRRGELVKRERELEVNKEEFEKQRYITA